MRITLRTPQTAKYRDCEGNVQPVTLPANVEMKGYRDGPNHTLVEVAHPEVTGGIFMTRIHNMVVRLGGPIVPSA